MNQQQQEQSNTPYSSVCKLLSPYEDVNVPALSMLGLAELSINQLVNIYF